MILLIRHCTPKVDYSRCDYTEAIKRMNQYNTTKDVALNEIESFGQYLTDLKKEQDLKIFSSSRARSLITAQEIFGGKFDIDVQDIFVEFDLKILPIPFIKLRFKTWLLISRIMWFFGLLKTSKSFAQEKLRAIECAEILHQKAQNGKVVLVSHGLLNIFIEKHLITKHYARVNKMKNNCFTIIHLEDKRS
jgi:broad specificity phosphatase PhoE